MKEKKEKLVIILFFIMIFLFLASIVLPRNLSNLDEIWNYNMAKNIADGKIPYLDFNIIITPFLPFFCSIFLKIFGNQLIIMRFLSIILQLSILIMTFLILKKLKVNTYFSALLILGIIYLMQEQIAIDYNFFVLAILLVIMYIELKQNQSKIILLDKKQDILVGFLSGIAICTKQTTGIAIFITLMMYKIILVKNKEDLIKFGKSILYKILGVSIPLIILSVYFTINGVWEEFIKYCITGIKSFTNKISYKLLFEKNIFVKTLAAITPIIIIYMLVIYIEVRNKKTQYKYNICTIVPFAIAQMILIYPISDENHFLIGTYPLVIGTIYIFYNLLKTIFNKITTNVQIILFIKNFTKMCAILFIVYISIWYSIPKLNEYVNETYKSKLNHFEQIPIDDLEDRIEQISNYIKKQDEPVYILDAEAAIYKIPIDKYSKNYDMFLKGNLGQTEEEQIQEIKNKKEQVIFLIKNQDYQRNWQSPEKVVNYVQDNYQKTGEINIYDIYKK